MFLLNNEEKLLHCLKGAADFEVISENRVLLNKYDLIVDFNIKEIKEYEKLIMVETEFKVNHEFFCEPIIEVTAGVEDNINDAINQCVKNFTSSLLDTVIEALDKDYDEEIDCNFFNSKKSYYVTKGIIKTIGEKEDNEEIDYWDIISDKIKERLENKKALLIRVYASKLKNGDLDCECRINGIIERELTYDIKNHIKDLNISTNFYSCKQFFIAKQKEETYERYPYNKSEIMEFTRKAIKVLGSCDSEEKFNKINIELYKISKDENVAYEIRTFVPEILCELVFSEAYYSDKIILVKNNRQIEGFKRQFTSYAWIYETVIKAFNERILNEKELKTIVSFSATYNSIAEALNSGRKIEELHLLYGINGPEGYMPL